jgi:hypothetical protein
MSIRSLTQLPQGAATKIQPGPLSSMESTDAALARHGVGPLKPEQVLLLEYSPGSTCVDSVVHYPGFQSERLSISHRNFDTGESRNLTLQLPTAPPEPGPGRNDLTQMLEQIHSTQRELEGVPTASAHFQSNTPDGQRLVAQSEDGQLAWQLADQVREFVEKRPPAAAPTPGLPGNALLGGAVIGWTSHLEPQPELRQQGHFDRNSGSLNFFGTTWKRSGWSEIEGLEPLTAVAERSTLEDTLARLNQARQ